MKPLTNILLAAYLIVYITFPLFNVDFDGGWAGIKYTSETLTRGGDALKMAFALIPFIAVFLGIAVNCLKSRLWGVLVAAFCALGISFYIGAQRLDNIQMPEFYSINSLGYGFNIGVGLLVAALVSAIVSVIPLKINRRLAHELPPAEPEPEPAHEPAQEPAQEPEAVDEDPYAAYMPKSSPDEN